MTCFAFCLLHVIFSSFVFCLVLSISFFGVYTSFPSFLLAHLMLGALRPTRPHIKPLALKKYTRCILGIQFAATIARQLFCTSTLREARKCWLLTQPVDTVRAEPASTQPYKFTGILKYSSFNISKMLFSCFVEKTRQKLSIPILFEKG